MVTNVDLDDIFALGLQGSKIVGNGNGSVLTIDTLLVAIGFRSVAQRATGWRPASIFPCVISPQSI